MIATLHETWFGTDPSDAAQLAHSASWWRKDPAFDEELRSRFAVIHREAAAGAHLDWLHDPRGTVAYIVLTDQIPRNIHRDTPDAFATDGLARAACLAARMRGWHHDLTPMEQVLLNMPLMHAEDRILQQLSVRAFERLADRAPAALENGLRNNLHFAKRHAEIVERFGRYPHRNAILGRTTTDEEAAFLKTPNSSF